jgi:fructose-bisphosphate aldolase class II
MPVVPIRQILDPAFTDRYGVAAINIVDDLSLEAVLAAATEMESPLIVQTSLKTVKSIGAKALYNMWRTRADAVPVPV